MPRARLSSFFATSVPVANSTHRNGHRRSKPVRPNPWPKCRAPYSDPKSRKTACWHRVPPECLHDQCQRAYQPPGGPELPHTHHGGQPCCPGPCRRPDDCQRCRDRCPREFAQGTAAGAVTAALRGPVTTVGAATAPVSAGSSAGGQQSGQRAPTSQVAASTRSLPGVNGPTLRHANVGP